MRTRAEAVEYLKKRGLHAAERDWVLGETVFVGTAGQGSPRMNERCTSSRRKVCGRAWSLTALGPTMRTLSPLTKRVRALRGF